MGYGKDLKHKVTVRVSDEMRAWVNTVGADAVRSVLEHAMGVAEFPKAEAIVAAVSPPVAEANVKAAKRAKASPRKVEEAAPVVARSVIPTDPAERAAYIAKAREASEAKTKRIDEYKAGLSPIHRRYLLP